MACAEDREARTEDRVVDLLAGDEGPAVRLSDGDNRDVRLLDEEAERPAVLKAREVRREELSLKRGCGRALGLDVDLLEGEVDGILENSLCLLARLAMERLEEYRLEVGEVERTE